MGGHGGPFSLALNDLPTDTISWTTQRHARGGVCRLGTCLRCGRRLQLVIVFATLTWCCLCRVWWVEKGIVPAEVEKGHVGVEFNVDTHLIKDSVTQLLEAVRIGRRALRFVPSCIWVSSGRLPASAGKRGLTSDVVGEDGESQTTPWFFRKNILVCLLPPSPACFFCLSTVKRERSYF